MGRCRNHGEVFMSNNILILSVGTRNKVIQYFMNNKGSNDTVICADMSVYAPALYEADKFFITPQLTNENYINFILDICEQEKITCVLSLIDPELKILAEHKSLFIEKNIMLCQSSLDLINISFDKYKFYKTLSNKNFKSQKSYINLKEVIEDLYSEKLSFPLFVKPNLGSASLNINKVYDENTLNNLFKKYDDLIVQEFVDGKEYGVDVYIDMISKEVISIFIKEKIKMRAGETDKSISIKDKELLNLINLFVKDMGYVGQIDIDVFYKDGEYYISEVNPRFGGGYPHAYEAGCNFPKYILNNLNGIANEPEIGNYEEGTVMMKYNELKFIRKEV